MDELSEGIKRLTAAALAGFIIVCLMLTYWQAVAAPRLEDAEENNRVERIRRRVQPGRLLTSDGLTILDAKETEDGWERVYADTEAFCHLTGYNARSGLQKTLSDVFYAQKGYSQPWEDILQGRPAGNDITLTINGHLQQLARRMMRGRRGAVIALEPESGALLVLYSAPTYDPTGITRSEDDYNVFRYDPEKPEINRPLQGMYPPGSVFKIFTAAAAIDAGLSDPGAKLECAGAERIAGTLVKCRRSGGHGKITLRRALADSCNIAFAKLGNELGPDRFRGYVKSFHLLDAANLPLPTSTGRMADFKGFKGEMQLAEASFGQGASLLTPLSIARLTATIARGGEVVQPFIVADVRTAGGRVITRGEGHVLGRAISKETAQAVAGMMRSVVEEGTGGVADIAGVEVAAKTGSAQNPAGEPHAWFTCFAPADSPSVVVTVIVENGGSGSAVAGPVAVAVLRAALGE
jgi:penicillin-binding protein A